MPTLTKLFSMQEASEHNSKDDCWVVIHGKMPLRANHRAQQSFPPPPQVYDVTSYIDEHPGGDDVFFDAKGKDAKEEFDEAGHSQDARDLMEKFCVGELDPSAVTIRESEIPSNKTSLVEKIKSLPTEYWAVPGAIVGIAVIVGFLYLRK